MPIPFLFYTLQHGPPAWLADNAWTITTVTVAVTVLFYLKRYTSGALNPAENNMHGKVVLVTGGTTGICAQAVKELGKRGAQLVLLTQTPASDPFLVEYIQDLRDQTGNNLIYAEHVDLSSLHSIRTFATKWIDNAPPRRLDMIILGASTLSPPGGKRLETKEGIEATWMTNYLANFHLLSILSPAIKVQPFDRDVRIIMLTCSSYISSPSLKEVLEPGKWTPSVAYARSKLALNVFGQAFQKHLDSYKRPDQLPMNSRVIFVDPGVCRTPSTRRWLTRGSLWGLAIYLSTYAFWWLILKPPFRGAQSVLYAAMAGEMLRGGGGKLIKECMEVDFARSEVKDEDAAKKLWEESDALIEKVEKVEAKKRAAKKAADERAAKEKSAREQKTDLHELVDAIKQNNSGDTKQGGKSRSRKKGKKVEFA